MADYILNLLSQEFSFFGYSVLALIAALEATPMFGFLVPGQVVAVSVGILAKIGSVNFLNAVVFLSLGAVAGDLIGYLLGKKYGEEFILKYGKYFFLKKKNYNETKALVCEHCGKTIILGRFNSITRALTPFVAGSVKIPFLKFIFFDTLGGISWAIFFPLLGYLFSNHYQAITDYFGEFFVVGILIGGLIIYLYKKINKKRRIFYRRHIYILLINIFSLYLFFKMLENFVDQELIIYFDQWLNLKLAALRTPFWDKLMIFITSLANTQTILIASPFLLAFFISKKKWRYSLFLILSLSGGKILEVLVKRSIGRVRPDNAIIETTGASFPSGHATIAIIFFSILIYYFKNHLENKLLKKFLIIIGIVIIISVGFSRIYLGAHWFSDVIGGFALGAFWLTLMILFLEFITTVFKEKVAKIKKRLNK